MQTEALVALTPDDLVALILKKQRALAQALPALLTAREDELSRAYRRTKQAKAALAEVSGAHSNDRTALTAAEAQYKEHEAFRRRSESRTHQLRNANANLQATLAYWSDEQRPWLSLMEAAQRVAEGHPPMFASREGEEAKNNG